MDDMLKVGVITTTHGLQGEVKVFPTTDDINRFKELKQIFLDTENGIIELEIERVKFFKNLVILKFKNYNTINDIEKYKGKSLLVTRENAVPLNKDEYFIADIIDSKVVDDKQEQLGILIDVLSTGANDVYVVKTESGKEILLPAIKDCILKVDVKEKMITVHVLDGLLD